MRVEPALLHCILLGGRAGDRFLNETAIQPDVWTRFAEGAQEVDLLLAPLRTLAASELARQLAEEARDFDRQARSIAPIEGFVAVRVTLQALVNLILPAAGVDIASYAGQLSGPLDLFAKAPKQGREVALEEAAKRLAPPLRLALVVLLLLAEAREAQEPGASSQLAASDIDFGHALDAVKSITPKRRSIWQVSLNRPVELAAVSIETIKADAARRVFEAKCGNIVWAVIDSGIDASHPAFRDHARPGYAHRVDKAYDFSILRSLVSFDTLLSDRDPLTQAMKERAQLSEAQAEEFLETLRDDARRGRPLDWAVLSRLLQCEPDVLPPRKDEERPVAHGTHVAGVLAGDWRVGDRVVYQGVCPDLRLYDLRILGDTEADTEFAVIGALEFIRWLNTKNRYLSIHGANLSLGIRHDVRNFACGQTPVCRACDATIRNGVVVVAAAGNWGSQDYLVSGGQYSGYAPLSIADPGNAENVITVGSTHRDRPFEYGVSFFSSRGPTGDGRSKPDLVAPGEKIDGPLPNLGFGRLDGTSMAAPHVSGAAALFLARYPEFIGQPLEVKRRLIASAMSLGRERYFQGAGLVDSFALLAGASKGARHET